MFDAVASSEFFTATYTIEFYDPATRKITADNPGIVKALELVDSKTFETGVLYLSYRPKGE